MRPLHDGVTRASKRFLTHKRMDIAPFGRHWSIGHRGPTIQIHGVETTIDLAMDGPEKLQPHQRGQLAHIVSTYEGAREFAERTPPAEWLCVFDPLCRYASPEQLGVDRS